MNSALSLPPTNPEANEFRQTRPPFSGNRLAPTRRTENFSKKRTNKMNAGKILKRVSDIIASGGSCRFIAGSVAAAYYIIDHSDFGRKITPDQRIFAAAVCSCADYLKSGKISLAELKEAAEMTDTSFIKVGFFRKFHGIKNCAANKKLVCLTMQIEALIFRPQTAEEHIKTADIIIGDMNKISSAVNENLAKGRNGRLYKSEFKTVCAFISANYFQEIVLSSI